MKIKFSPQSNDNKISYKKIDENTISVNGEEIMFDESLVEYDVVPIDEIIKAYRDLENNQLHLELLYRYPENEKYIWENPNYYENGGYRGTQYEDFTDLENGGEII